MTQQARAPRTQPFGREAFDRQDGTVLRWLGMAGFLINSRGTVAMIDPLLEDFDMPLMIDFPIAAQEVPRLDAVLVTVWSGWKTSPSKLGARGSRSSRPPMCQV